MMKELIIEEMHEVLVDYPSNYNDAILQELIIFLNTYQNIDKIEHIITINKINIYDVMLLLYSIIIEEECHYGIDKYIKFFFINFVANDVIPTKDTVVKSILKNSELINQKAFVEYIKDINNIPNNNKALNVGYGFFESDPLFALYLIYKGNNNMKFNIKDNKKIESLYNKTFFKKEKEVKVNKLVAKLLLIDDLNEVDNVENGHYENFKKPCYMDPFEAEIICYSTQLLLSPIMDLYESRLDTAILFDMLFNLKDKYPKTDLYELLNKIILDIFNHGVFSIIKNDKYKKTILIQHTLEEFVLEFLTILFNTLINSKEDLTNFEKTSEIFYYKINQL